MAALNEISQLRDGDRVRDPSGKAWVVATVIGGVAHLCRTQVLEVITDGWELVGRNVEPELIARKNAEIVALEAEVKALKENGSKKS